VSNALLYAPPLAPGAFSQKFERQCLCRRDGGKTTATDGHLRSFHGEAQGKFVMVKAFTTRSHIDAQVNPTLYA
jgi:hypothetical protein